MCNNICFLIFFIVICSYVCTYLGVQTPGQILLGQLACYNGGHLFCALFIGLHVFVLWKFYCLNCRLFDCNKVLTTNILTELTFWNARRFGLNIFEWKVNAHPPPPSYYKPDFTWPLIWPIPDQTKFYISTAFAPKARRLTSKETFAWRSSLYKFSNQLCYVVLFNPFVQFILCGHLWTIMFLVSRWYTFFLWWTCSFGKQF